MAACRPDSPGFSAVLNIQGRESARFPRDNLTRGGPSRGGRAADMPGAASYPKRNKNFCCVTKGEPVGKSFPPLKPLRSEPF